LFYRGTCVGGIRWMSVREDFSEFDVERSMFSEAAEKTSNAQLSTPNA